MPRRTSAPHTLRLWRRLGFRPRGSWGPSNRTCALPGGSPEDGEEAGEGGEWRPSCRERRAPAWGGAGVPTGVEVGVGGHPLGFGAAGSEPAQGGGATWRRCSRSLALPRLTCLGSTRAGGWWRAEVETLGQEWGPSQWFFLPPPPHSLGDREGDGCLSSVGRGSEGCLSADWAWHPPCGWHLGTPVLGLGISGPSRQEPGFLAPPGGPCSWTVCRLVLEGAAGRWLLKASVSALPSESHDGRRRSLCGRGVGDVPALCV